MHRVVMVAALLAAFGASGCDLLFLGPEREPIVPGEAGVDAILIDAPPSCTGVRVALTLGDAYISSKDPAFNGGTATMLPLMDNTRGLWRFELPTDVMTSQYFQLDLELPFAATDRSCVTGAEVCAPCAVGEKPGRVDLHVVKGDMHAPTTNWGCRREIGPCFPWDMPGAEGDDDRTAASIRIDHVAGEAMRFSLQDSFLRDEVIPNIAMNPFTQRTEVAFLARAYSPTVFQVASDEHDCDPTLRPRLVIIYCP